MAKGTVSTGWKLVIRHHRILWWVFFVNLMVGVLASVGPRLLFGKVLDNSMNSARLVDGFDLTAFFALLMKPEISLGPLVAGSLVLAGLFMLFMLFISGGILVTYREDRKLSTAEFFEASGAYFWRMVRLMLMSLVPFVIINIAWTLVSSLSSKLSSDAPQEKLGFWVQVISGFVLLLVFLLVRLWFDVAQVRAVAQDERGMFHNLMRTFRVAKGAIWSLLWMYFRISLLAWGAIIFGGWAWANLPSRATMLTILVLEGILLLQFFARLWQKASCIAWYHQYAVEHPVAQVDFVTPPPSELVEPAPAPAPTEAVELPPQTPTTPTTTS